MVVALVGLTSDLEAVRNQILSSPTVPTYDLVQEQLLHLSISHTFGPSSTSTKDSSALISHSSHRGEHGIHYHYCKNRGHVEADRRIKARKLSQSVM
ncbi:hypothetical protein GmHk_01G000915 [Glycine max]|nr:hypothetical protein GmHk_01G000915 [Glycine max]